MKPKPRSRQHPGLIVVAFATAGMTIQSARAAAQTWDAGAGTQDWNTSTNWTGDVFPTGNAIINTGSGLFPIITITPTWTGMVDLLVANGTGTTGRVDQRGGIVSTGVGNWMKVGIGGTATGVYNLADTSVTGQGNLTTFGQGTGSLTVGGTSTTSGRLVLGDGGTSQGTFNMNTTGTLTTRQTASSESTTAAIIIGRDGGTGTFRMDSGTVDTQLVEIGRTNGNGSLGIGGGVFNATGGLLIGRSTAAANTGAGTVTVGSGGTLNVTNELAVGYGGNGATGAAAGTLTVAGTVKLTSSASVLNVGVFDSVKGTLNINSGADIQLLNNSGMRLAVATGNAGTAVVNQNGGTLAFYGNSGTTLGGTGVLDMQLSTTGASTNTYNLNGGTLAVTKVQSTGSTGARTFNFNGGELKATIASTSFFNLNQAGTHRANVRDGGAIINTNGFDVTIAEALLQSNVGGDAGTGGLGKSGAGTLTLSNTNTYAGTTLVTAGTLAEASTGFIHDASALTVNGATAVFSLGAGHNDTVGTVTLDGGGSITGSGTSALTSAGAFEMKNGSAGVVLAGIGIALNKTTSGTVTLGGANTYTGATTIGGGKLVVTGSLHGSSAVALNAGTLDGTGTVGTVTVGSAGAAGSKIVANGNGTTAKLTLGSLVFSGGGTIGLNLPGGGANTTEGLIISGALQTSGIPGSVMVNITPTAPLTPNTAYNLIKYGSYGSGGYLDFIYGGNTARKTGTFADDTGNRYITLTVAGDTPKWTGVDDSNWVVGTTGASGNWKLVAADSATDYIQGDDVLFDDTASNKSVIISAADVNPSSTTFNNSTGNDYTLAGSSGLAGAGPLVKNGTGKVTVTTMNGGFTGLTTINTGILELGDGTTDGAVANTAGVSNSGALAYNPAGTQTAGYAISGTGVVTKTGAGAVVLSGANTYSGGTTLNAGTLKAGSTTALGSTAGMLTINGGSLDSSVANLVLANNNAQNWNGDFTFTGTNNLNLGTGAVALGSNRQVTVSANTLTVGGAISGSGFSLTKTGAGMLALTGANSYSGGTMINNGTLAIGGAATANSGALGAGAVTVGGGGILRTGFAVSTNTNVATVANDFTLAGGSVFADDGFQHLGGAVNVTAASTLGSTYNAGNNNAGEQNKGLFLDGVVSGNATLILQHSGISTGNTYNTSIVYFTNAANTYSGTVTVTPMTGTGGGSYLGLNAANALQFSNVNLSGNNSAGSFGTSTLVFNSGLGTAALGALSGSGNVVLTGYNETTHTYTGGGDIALTVGGNNSSTTYSGVMSGAGSLTKSGSGTMLLSGTNTFTGDLTINNGTLTAATGQGAAPAAGNLGALQPAANRNLTINNGGILSLTGGNVLGTGGSTNTLSNTTLVVNAGGVFQTGSNAGGAGWWNKIGAVTLGGGTIHVGGGANNTNFQGLALIGDVTVTGSTASVIDNLGSSDNAYNAVHLGQNATAGQVVNFNVADVTGNSSADLTVSAKLINTSSNLIAGGLNKTGSGTMLLSAANTYSGATTVNAGVLKVSGSIGSSAVTVNNPGTVLASGTSGTIGGSVVMNSGAILAAGNTNAVGTATVGSGGTTMNSGSIFSWDLDTTAANTAGTGYDNVVTSSLTGDVGGAAAVFAVVLKSGQSFTDTFWNSDHSWDNIFSTTGSAANALGMSSAFSGFTYNGSGSAPVSGAFTFTGPTGSILTWSAVPEPATALAGLLLGAGLFRRRRVTGGL